METLVPRRTFVIKFDGCRTELGAAERTGTARRTFFISARSDGCTVFGNEVCVLCLVAQKAESSVHM